MIDMSTSCIVLAGGAGTRLRSAVPDLPKCLAPVAGRPFLEWQLRSLSKRGIDSFVLALGYGSQKVVSWLKEPWVRDLKITRVIEPQPLGTGGATRFAMKETGLDEALVINGDTWLGGPLQVMLDPINLAAGERMRIAIVEVPNRERFGGVSVGAEHRVNAFIEKGQIGAGPINSGLYRIHRSVFDTQPSGMLSMESEVMPRLIEERALSALAVAGPLIDIGVPDDYHFFDQHVYEFVSRD